MGLFDFISSPFGSGSDIYDVTQGLPGYTQGVNQQGVQNAQANSQDSIGKQGAFLNALQGSNWMGNQQNVFSQQQGLANQLSNQAAGGGPNPAQAQLAQNTGNNVQQQAALMASARGSRSNPGLVARQSAQQGAATQQQAVGQAATLGAQQQLGAQQALGVQQAQMANLSTAGIGQQQTALNQLNQNNLGYQQMMQQGLQAQNQNQVQAQLGQAQLAQIGMNNRAGLVGGGMNSVGGMLSGPFGGGGMADGGVVGSGAATGAGAGFAASQMPDTSPAQIQNQVDQQSPKSLMGQHQADEGAGVSGLGGGEAGTNAIFQGASSLGSALTGSTQVKGIAKQAKPPIGGDSGGGGGGASSMLGMLALLSEGGKINGMAKVKGDSKENDTVPAMLSPGEIVIPRSHVDSPDKIASFLNGLLGTNFKNTGKQKTT